MPRVFIAVGSNLGDRNLALEGALIELEKTPGVRVKVRSAVYETDPVGGPPQGAYLNAVWEIETVLGPADLMRLLLDVEERFGRKRGGRPNEPRTLDLDLLFYEHEILEEPGLRVPHPRLHERAFVLRPLAELVPDWTHPVLHKTAMQLLESLDQRPDAND